MHHGLVSLSLFVPPCLSYPISFFVVQSVILSHEAEEEVNGLIIIEAQYGKLVSSNDDLREKEDRVVSHPHPS